MNKHRFRTYPYRLNEHSFECTHLHRVYAAKYASRKKEEKERGNLRVFLQSVSTASTPHNNE